MLSLKRIHTFNCENTNSCTHLPPGVIQSRQSSYQHVIGRTEETGEPRGNPHQHGENMQNSIEKVTRAQDKAQGLSSSVVFFLLICMTNMDLLIDIMDLNNHCKSLCTLHFRTEEIHVNHQDMMIKFEKKNKKSFNSNRSNNLRLAECFENTEVGS